MFILFKCQNNCNLHSINCKLIQVLVNMTLRLRATFETIRYRFGQMSGRVFGNIKFYVSFEKIEWSCNSNCRIRVNLHNDKTQHRLFLSCYCKSLTQLKNFRFLSLCKQALNIYFWFNTYFGIVKPVTVNYLQFLLQDPTKLNEDRLDPLDWL